MTRIITELMIAEFHKGGYFFKLELVRRPRTSKRQMLHYGIVENNERAVISRYEDQQPHRFLKDSILNQGLDVW